MTTAAFIRFDLFPSSTSVTAADGSVESYPKSRVVVTDSEVYVYVDGDHGTPVAAYVGQLDDYNSDSRSSAVVETSDGGTVRADRSSGCGCGSRLRGFRPFAGVPMAAA